MPLLPPPWHEATMTTIHTASTVRDLGVVGALSLATTPLVMFGHDRPPAADAAESDVSRAAGRMP